MQGTYQPLAARFHLKTKTTVDAAQTTVDCVDWSTISTEKANKNLTAKVSTGVYGCYNSVTAHRFAGSSSSSHGRKGWKGKENGSDRRSEFHVRRGAVDLGGFRSGLSGVVAVIILYLWRPCHFLNYGWSEQTTPTCMAASVVSQFTFFGLCKPHPFPGKRP